MDAIIDTSVLIDVWRETRRAGPAREFLKNHLDWQIGLPWVAKAEYLAGAIWAGHNPAQFMSLLDAYPIVQSSEEIIASYANLFASLKKQNSLPGLNDLWLAATGLTLGCGIITRNAKHFNTISGLTVFNYSQQ